MTTNPYLISRQAFLRGAALTSLIPFLPVIRPALAAAIGVTEVAPGIFVHQGKFAEVDRENAGDISNMSFIIGKEAVAVVDTGNSDHIGMAVREAISTITPLPIRYVINTHMHPDHVLGNAAFKADNPKFVAHHKMARALSARAEGYLARNKERMGDENFAGTEIVLPTEVVTDTLDLDLGARKITLRARPTAHTDNDLTIFDQITQTLLLGDLAFSVRIPTIDGSIVGWLKVIKELKSESTARVVPGHGPPSMEMSAAMGPMERYLTVVANDVRAAIKDGKTIMQATETAGLSEKDKWLLFDDNHKRNVTAAFAELEWE